MKPIRSTADPIKHEFPLLWYPAMGAVIGSGLMWFAIAYLPPMQPTQEQLATAKAAKLYNCPIYVKIEKE